jgi:hypothetical protein
MTALITAIGRSFLLSSYIPALAFVAINSGVFLSYLPEIRKDLGLYPALDVLVAFDIVASAFLSYLLVILNPYIVKLYEGYYVLKIFRCLKKRQIRRKQRLKDATAQMKQEVERIGQRDEEFHKTWRVYIEHKAREIEEFPKYASDVLPTRLGNVFRAFEDYPYQRYGMEAVFFWPLMTRVIPDEYAQRVEELNNFVAFTLASSLLCLVMSLEAIIIWVCRERPLLVGIALACLVMFYLLHRWAVLVSLSYGQYFRHCFDLFRLDLLKELGLKPPKDLTKEKELWRKVHEFLTLAEGDPYAEQSQERIWKTAATAMTALLRAVLYLSIARFVEILLGWDRPHHQKHSLPS